MKCDQLRDEYGYPLHHAQLKKEMGLRPEHKYGVDESFEKTVGNTRVILLTTAAAVERAGHDNRPHRLFAECNVCHKLIPAGRMGQHYKAHS
jgi:hypothetical protein